MTPLLLLASLTLSQAAEAGKLYMWGVGPYMGSNLLPGQYPLTNPKVKDWEEKQQDAEISQYAGENGYLSEEIFVPVRGDFQMGARAMAYINKDFRIAMRMGGGFGSNYRNGQITVELDKMLFADNGFSAFFGGGIGGGRQTFKSDTDGAEVKSGMYIPRVQLGGQYKINKKGAIELDVYAQLPVSPNQVLVTDGGTEVPVGIGLNPFQYLQGGVELTGYFGDFAAKEGGGKKKGKKKGKK